MKLKHISIQDTAPIKRFEVGDLAEFVVFAGPNGVGKTRILSEILTQFRNVSPGPRCRLIVEATSPEEKAGWGGLPQLDTAVQAEGNVLRQHLQKNKKRGHLVSGVLNFGDPGPIGVDPAILADHRRPRRPIQ